MRILTVSHFFDSHGGGLERVAGHLVRQFAALGHESIWAASGETPPDADIAKAVPLACINPTEALTGLPMPIPGPRGLAALWREVGRADALVIHDALYVTSIAAMLMGRLRRLGGWRGRVVLIQHIAAIPFASPVLRGVMGLANLLVTRPMLGAADEVVFISATVREALLGSPPRRSCHLVFNGVDGAIFSPQGAPEDGRGAPLPGTGRRVLFVGRFVEKKGLAVLRALAASRGDLTFLLAGAGPMDPAGWGLPNVHVLGVQSAQALAGLYRAADLLLLPSVGEGYPLVIQEAMACVLPVVCGQPSDRADPGAAAWLRGVPIDLADPEGSARACAAAIDTLAPDAPEPAASRAASRAAMAAYAARLYSWRAMAEAVLACAVAPPR